MTLADAITSLFPKARFGTDFVVSETYDPKTDKPGPEAVTFWNEETLGKRDDAAIEAEIAKPADLRPYAATVRYARETAGVTVNTAQVATDRDSQQAITGMWAAAQIDPSITVQFKTASGAFVAIGADQIRKIASAVIAHVQACYAAEAQVVADIKAGKVTTTADVDAAFAAVA